MVAPPSWLRTMEGLPSLLYYVGGWAVGQSGQLQAVAFPTLKISRAGTPCDRDLRRDPCGRFSCSSLQGETWPTSAAALSGRGTSLGAPGNGFAAPSTFKSRIQSRSQGSPAVCKSPSSLGSNQIAVRSRKLPLFELE